MGPGASFFAGAHELAGDHMVLRTTCDFVGGWHGFAGACHGVVTCGLVHFVGGHRVF
jgi:hypothetical protein